ncbi:hypothetical protein K450DRAFT_244240 [Umbelopsis ramanniana AG]|uniref:Uncharacterized protein n=1 Tax=Umbelopsis ramanniana AG TaxID=1314678 RepID=A0AAD5E938_UMBRA|nr:uncharacterized protein K450DRAFT_244240 [Umbelopsis ramanniana AG]KAI8578944.1 hypothetical protein K450DRAFT_244240 [Umbelopsis ramanniana AG]
MSPKHDDSWRPWNDFWPTTSKKSTHCRIKLFHPPVIPTTTPAWSRPLKHKRQQAREAHLRGFLARIEYTHTPLYYK